MKVLVINRGNSDNLGDQAIKYSLIKFLEEKKIQVAYSDFIQLTTSLPDKNIKDKTNTTSFLKKILRQSAFLVSIWHFFLSIRWFFKNKSEISCIASQGFDAVFIGGGQLILSGGLFPIALCTWSFLLKKNKQKVYIMGVGSGIRFNFFERLLYKKAFASCEKIFLRDSKSIELIKNLFGYNAYFIPDLAYLYPIKKGNKSALNKKNNKCLIIGIVDYAVFLKYHIESCNNNMTVREYVYLWVDEIRKLIHNNNYTKLVLASSTKKDAYYSSVLYEILKAEQICDDIINMGYLDLDNFCQSLRQADGILSGRMHSLILSQLIGLDIFPWVISQKIASYAQDYLHEDVIVLQKKIENIIMNIIK